MVSTWDDKKCAERRGRPLVLSARDDGARLRELESSQPALTIGAQGPADVTAQSDPGPAGSAGLAPRDERGSPCSSGEDSGQRFAGGGRQIHYRTVEGEDLVIE